MSKVTDKIESVLRNGFQTQKEIATFLGVAQSTVSKHIKILADSILVLPNSRPAKYALPSSIDGIDYKYPFSDIDSHGKRTFIGDLYTLKNGHFFVKLYKSSSSLYLGSKKNGLYDGLPYFLDDLRPQGFIGNQLANKLHSAGLGYPKDLARWNSSHILKYLTHYGFDLPGNIVIYNKSMHPLSTHVSPVVESSYDFMATQAESGDVSGSSAGGEQQKFITFNKNLNAHVLVKFTSNVDNDLTRRWKDILVTEYHALKTLEKLNIPSAQVRLIDSDNRFYLETKRFDRVGTNGRSSLLSLMAIDMEFTGIGGDWYDVYLELDALNLVVDTDMFYVAFLSEFSKWIGNTDTHLGNISFRIDGNKFSLLPIYDMCSMAIAPSTNNIKPININFPNKGFELAMMPDAVKLFWRSVYVDERLSDEFREYIRNNKTINDLMNS